MRTKHTYICVFCGGEFPKDWLFRPGHDDPEACCEPCYDTRVVIDWVDENKGIGRMLDKATGEYGFIPINVIKAQ